MSHKVFLITGAALRIGANISRVIHSSGVNVVIHCNSSREEASTLVDELNSIRPKSARLIQFDLLKTDSFKEIIRNVHSFFGRLDGVVNNASSFYPTSINEISEENWANLMGTNIKAPLFLSAAANEYLKKYQGSITSILDIHAEKPMPNHIIYSIAKAAHMQMVRSLSIELAPEVRVNGVSPGVNLLPSSHPQFNSDFQQIQVSNIPLKRAGKPSDIASAVLFLALENTYITGQILNVDGGKSVLLPE